MSRSISIDKLSFHNLKIGTSDSIKFKFDETKSDKTGEFVTEKNCYANPFDPGVCLFTALAVWISLNKAVLDKTPYLFITLGAKVKSASQRYCRQLSELVHRHWDVAKLYLPPMVFEKAVGRMPLLLPQCLHRGPLSQTGESGRWGKCWIRTYNLE